MSLYESTHAGHMLGNASSSVEGKPLLLELEVVGLTLSNASLTFQMVDPEVFYDGWRMGLISHSPQSEGRGGVQDLLGNVISIVQFKDLGPNVPDLQTILLVQLKTSFTEVCLGRPSRPGCFTFLGLWSFPHLGWCGPTLGTACRGLMATFQESKREPHFEAS